MSLQRRRGREVTFYWPTEVTDRRGNRVLRPQGDKVTVRCSESFDRSNRAEVPGQQLVHQVAVRVPVHAMAQLWTVAFYRDAWWDVAAPPAERFGRRVEHLTVVLRKRPDVPKVG